MANIVLTNIDFASIANIALTTIANIDLP